MKMKDVHEYRVGGPLQNETRLWAVAGLGGVKQWYTDRYASY